MKWQYLFTQKGNCLHALHERQKNPIFKKIRDDCNEMK